MSNLLPQKEIENIQKVTLVRVLTIGGWILAISMVINTLALGPTYIAARSYVSALTSETEALQESLTIQQDAIDRDELTAARDYIDALDGLVQGDLRPSRAIRTILELRPGGIAINTIQYNRKGEEGALILAGSSSGIRQLTEYGDVLRAERMFTAIDVPVTALVHASEGAFTMTITGEF